MKIFWACMTALLFVFGCTTTSVYEPEHLARENGKALSVRTKDGREVRFCAGEYAVTAGAHGSVKGKGELVTDTVVSSGRTWEGTLSFDEIASVASTEPNVLGIVSLCVLGSAWVTMVTLLTSR